MAQKPQGTGPATERDQERQQQHQQEMEENRANRDGKARQEQAGDEGHRVSPGGQQSR
jgi:hypothetical protein